MKLSTLHHSQIIFQKKDAYNGVILSTIYNTSLELRLIFVLLFVVSNSLLILGQLPEDYPISNNKFLVEVISNNQLEGFASPKILADEDNILWIPWISGLIKYDGIHSDYFNHLIDPDKFKNTVPYDVFDDNEGKLWIPFKEGILTFNKNTHKTIIIENDSIINLDTAGGVRYIIQHISDDLFYVLTNTGNFGRISKGAQNDSLGNYTYTFQNLLPDDYSICFERLNENEVWLATDELVKITIDENQSDKLDITRYKIACLEGIKYEIRKIEHIEGDIFAVYAVDLNRNTYLFFFDPLRGLCNMLPNLDLKMPTWRYLRFSEQLVFDSNNNLWWSIFGNQLVKFNLSDSFNYLNDSLDYSQIDVFKADNKNNESLNNNYIHRLIEDKTANVWISTNGAVWKYSEQYDYIKKVNLPRSYKDELVKSVIYDQNSKLYWLATSNGILTYDQKKNKFDSLTIKNTRGEIPTKNYELIRDSSGTVWVGSQTGLYSIKTSTSGKAYSSSRHIDPGDEYTWESTIDMDFDKDGNIWVLCGYGRIYCFNPIKGKFKKLELVKGRIMSNLLFIDSKDHIWVNDRSGNLYDIQVKEINENKILGQSKLIPLKNQVSLIVESDKNNQLTLTNHSFTFFGTYETKLKSTDTYLNFKTTKPLFIIDLIQDQYENIWLMSPKKLYLFQEGFEELIPVSEEIINLETSTSSSIHSNENELLVPSRSSFYQIDLTKLKLKNAYRTRIANIKVNGKSVKNIDQYSQGNYSIEVLEHDQNNLEVYISLFDLSDDGNQYIEYSINNDDHWHIFSPDGRERFSELAPRDYHISFRTGVKGNREALDRITTLVFKIKEPWYWSSAFKLIYVILFLGFSFLLFRLILVRKLALQEAKKVKEISLLRSQLFANITHEFRTPLTVILGMANELKSKITLSENLNDYLNPVKLISKNGQELLKLVNQILEHSKADVGKLKLKFIQSDIISLLNYLVESYQSYAESKVLTLTFHPDVDEMMMDFDSDKINTIISNLISNAMKFTDEGGEIKVYAHLNKNNDESHLLIKIQDTGIGIAKEDIDHVFDRFYRVQTSTFRKNEGSGIGLSLVNKLVKLHKGTISVNSELGNGSEFILFLPISNKAPFSSPEKIESEWEFIEEADKHSFVQDSKATDNLPIVLVVEDNKDVSIYLRHCLESKYKLFFARDGREGLDMAIDKIPDLIISDVMMPEMDGYELCNTLKTDIRTSHIPIVLLTAKVDIENRLEGLSKGADAYLAKPFNKIELNIRLEQLIKIRRKLREKYASQLISLENTDVSDDPDALFLQKAIDSILKRLDDSKYSSKDLSLDLRMSESNVYRKLKALTGKSTAIYIRSVRLHKSMELIKNGSLSISEVAFTVGFVDPAWFSKAFKEEFGHSPSHFKKNK